MNMLALKRLREKETYLKFQSCLWWPSREYKLFLVSPNTISNVTLVPFWNSAETATVSPLKTFDFTIRTVRPETSWRTLKVVETDFELKLL